MHYDEHDRYGFGRPDYDEREFESGRSDRQRRGRGPDRDDYDERNQMIFEPPRRRDREEWADRPPRYARDRHDEEDYRDNPYSRGRHESGAMMHGAYSGGSFGREQGTADLWSERGDRDTRATGPHAGRGPRNYRRSDERIHEDVCEALTRDPHVDATEIEVQVSDGEVTLTGTVDAREAKRRAEHAVEGCHGVKDVHNQLRIAG